MSINETLQKLAADGGRIRFLTNPPTVVVTYRGRTVEASLGEAHGPAGAIESIVATIDEKVSSEGAKP